jgi:three-Cys-motif partner protein
MGRADYREGVDGHQVRVAPDWTETKLRNLSAYISAFASACTSRGDWTALDLFAGAGLNYSKMDSKEIPASTMRILDAGPPHASLVVAAEKHAGLHAALAHRLDKYGPRADVVHCDGVANIHALLERIDPTLPAFAFLDPEGTELHWSAVEAIAQHKAGHPFKMEQLILFPTDTGFMRLLWPKPQPGFEAMVARMFGNEDWRPILADRQAGVISAKQARVRYIQLYAAGLRSLGYRHVLERGISAAVSRAPRYYLIFASDHPVGNKVMDHCFNMPHVHPLEPTGQQSLFQIPATPRKKIL